MTTLLDLPIECINHILTFLRPRYVQVLAQTLNKQILSQCVPFLAPFTEKARNKRRMEQIFGKASPVEVNPEDYDELDPSMRYSRPDDPCEHLDFLNLSGDLHWLLPLEEDQLDSRSLVWLASGSTVTRKEVENLQGQMTQLNIEKVMPGVFWRLMANTILQRSIPAKNPTMWNNERFGPASYFRIGQLYGIAAETVDRLSCRGALGKENKIIRDVVPEIRQYIFAFYTICRTRGFWYLYLDTSGGHCVLRYDDPRPRLATVHDFRSRISIKQMEWASQ